MREAFEKIIKLRRTVRRFKQDKISRNDLIKLVDMARLSPAGANKQPLVYLIVDEPDLVNEIFKCLKFGMYLGKEGTPKPGQTPTAYIIIGLRNDLNYPEAIRDLGAAAGTLCLGAVSLNLGACWLRNANRDKIASILSIPQDEITIDSVIALGYTDSFPVVEEMKSDDDIKYWRDENGVHHVPKRPLSKILWLNKYGNSYQ